MHEWAAVWRDAGPGREVVGVEARTTGSEVLVRVDYRLPAVDGRLEMLYRLYGDGAIRVDQHLSLGPGDLPKIPRVGTQLVLPQRFRFVSWFGRGPHESPSLRATGPRSWSVIS